MFEMLLLTVVLPTPNKMVIRIRYKSSVKYLINTTFMVTRYDAPNIFLRVLAL